MRVNGWTDAKLLLFGLLRTVSALAATEARAAGSSAAAVIANHHHHHHLRTSPVEQLPRLTLRLARRNDVPSIQRCNLATLPENYNQQFYANHMREWPDLAFVAVDCSPNNSFSARSFSSFPTSEPEEKVVAYVLGKIEECITTTSTAVSPSPRNAVQGRYQHDRAGFMQPWPHSERSPLGTATGSMYPTTCAATVRLGHVTSLAVLEPYRRRGLACELMKQLHFHLSTSYQVDSVGLHVRKSNLAAERLYAGFGYEAAECIPGYYQDGEDAMFMKKQLPQYTSSSLFGVIRRKVWETGPEDLRLPRLVGIPDYAVARHHREEDSEESTPELLTGTM